MPKEEWGTKITYPAEVGSGVISPGDIASGAVGSGAVADAAVVVGNLFEAHGTQGPVDDTAQTVNHNLGSVPAIYNVVGLSGAVTPGDIEVSLVNASQMTYLCATSGGYVHWFVLAP